MDVADSPRQRRKARLERRGNRPFLRRLRLPAAMVASGVVSAAAAVSVVTWYPRQIDHGIPAACHSGDPLAGVDEPRRLTLVQPCGVVTGTVECVRHPSGGDGDATFNVRVDPPYQRDLTPDNALITCPGSHTADLHVEIIPQQCGPNPLAPDDTNCANRAGFVSPALPRTGDRVLIIGPVVHDRGHVPRSQPGWAEIHPAQRLAVQVQAPPTRPDVVAPDPEKVPTPPLSSAFSGPWLGAWPHQPQSRHLPPPVRHLRPSPLRRDAAVPAGRHLR